MLKKVLIHLDDIISREMSDLVTSDIDGETVMMSIEKGNYYGLDRTGSRIWGILENPHTVSALVEKLLLEFEGERELIEKDVLTFLEKLVREGMLTVEASSHS